jgi:hypothetical protein
MTTKKIVSITIIIAMAAMFFSSSAFVNPLLAKTVEPDKDKTNDDSKDKTKDSNRDDTTTSTLITHSTSDKTKDSNKDDTPTRTSSSSESDFTEFQKCLSDAEGKKGFATNQEIKDCYNPIYRPLSATSTTTDDKTVKPIDFSTPVDFSKKISTE